ncbi:MAG: 50S ribosomal protein L31e [Candidatus Altiarchaeales archaeon ex4484_96]|nr:MAG: 50S ribosomal protein L31e [Candidatus Altiarchaeales archaeon ex4484_96]
MDERLYTIPLRDAFNAPKTKRTKKAVKVVKDYLKKHTKVDDVKLDTKLNELLWEKGIRKPPRRVKVKVVEEDGGVFAYLVD